MRKHYLTSVNEKTYEYIPDNFFDLTEYSSDVYVGRELGVTLRCKSRLSNLPATVSGIYYANGKHYFWASDGNFYRVNPTVFINIGYVGDKAPLVTEIIKDGISQVLVVGGDSAFSLRGTTKTDFNMPYGEFIAVCKGRVITAMDYTLNVSGRFDFESHSMASVNTVIKVPESTGGVAGLVSFDDYVLVVCSNAIYKLVSDGEFVFKLVKVFGDNLLVTKGTVKMIANIVYFINFSKLCFYDGNKIIKKDSLLEKRTCYLKGNAAVMNNKYLLPIATAGYMLVFIYDTLMESQAFVRVKSYILGDGGYIGDESSKTLMALDVSGSTNRAVWNSLPLDFGIYGKKKLLSLSIYCAKNATLEITGDFGRKVFLLKEGYNVKKFNLLSHAYTLKISALADDFTARDLKLQYKIIGG